MSHNIGRVVTIPPVIIGPGGPLGSTSPGVWEYTFVPQPAATGGSPRFVILHLTAMNLPSGARVEVPLGYATEVYTSGTDVWTRPIDTAAPIKVRFITSGSSGSVTLAEYGSGEPYTTTHPQSWLTNTTNPDLFLHASPYVEPTYHTWLECGGAFNWQNSACAVAGSIQEQTARAVGIFVHADHDEDSGLTLLSSCSGTLIDTNLFLTARHCATDPDELDIHSGSVTFGFQTNCDGTRPAGYAPRFYKVRRVAAAGAGVSNWVPESTDWLILELEEAPAGIAPRPLRGTNPVAGETVFTVHHPNAAVKKFQTGTLSGSSVTSVTGFDYAGGSSGSALFDGLGRVIGAALSTGGNGPYQCTVGYTPAANVLNALANPPAPPTPFDIMLVIDRSGSMGGLGTSGSTKMVEAREAASLFVQLVRLNAGDRLGMVSFSTTATVPVDEGPGNVNPGKKHQLVGGAPYTSGKIGGLLPGGSTSIGDGIQKAMGVLPSGTGNRRAILLLTDGMQNTAPTVAAVEPLLGDTVVHAVGFGTDAQLDGALLNALAGAHSGFYTRANDGLSLKKYFALAFGNIFEAGMLADPVLTLPAGVDEQVAVEFAVCDEERITAIIGWNSPPERLEAELVSPAGVVVDASTAGTVSDEGLTWWFLRVPLPTGGEREGMWRLRVRRPGRHTGTEFTGEFLAQDKDTPALRYVASVLADGGPQLVPLLARRRYYTGESINPLVALQYPNGTAPRGSVTLEVERLDGSLGALVQRMGLGQPETGEEPVGAFAAALQRIERDSGGRLPIGTVTETVTLYDDGVHGDGAMEPDGIWGNLLPDLLKHEGTYTFRAVAEYGSACRGRREASWSVHVEPGIDPGATDVTLTPGGLTIRPRDRYGNPLGPGRGDLITVTGTPGTTVTGGVVDNGDGSYQVPATWGSGTRPGLVVGQPGRDPAVLAPPGGPSGAGGCLLWLTIALAVIVVALLIALAIS